MPERPRTTFYENCDAVRAADAAPLHRDEPGYRPALDRDNDGVACEPQRPAEPTTPPTTPPATTPPTTTPPTTTPPTTTPPTTTPPTTTKPTTKPETEAPFYKNCDAAREAGAAPLHEGDAGYRRALDGDGDGIACEPK